MVDRVKKTLIKTGIFWWCVKGSRVVLSMLDQTEVKCTNGNNFFCYFIDIDKL